MVEYATKENQYICRDCGKETNELDLVGSRNSEGYFELHCSCGSKNITNSDNYNLHL